MYIVAMILIWETPRAAILWTRHHRRVRKKDALTPDFQTFIGRPNMLAGVAFVAAKPGSTISLYALGCGPTNPPTQAGVVAGQGAPLALTYDLKIGGVSANVTFAGIVAGSIGLYQLNVVVPDVAAGDQPIELTVDGVSTGQNMVIVVGQ
jgi:uncharacterized protein (TIGR03437 family)